MLTRKDLEHLCALARLRLPEGEADRLLPDLDRILGYVESLQAIDTSGVSDVLATERGDPAAHLREDQALPSPPHEEAMRNAPSVVDHHFGVPTVVDHGAERGTAGEL